MLVDVGSEGVLMGCSVDFRDYDAILSIHMAMLHL